MSKRLESYLLALAPLGALVLGWFALTGIGMVDPVFLPTPVRTFRSFFELLSTRFLFEHFVPSILRVGGAFLISVLIAFPVGVISGQVPWVARMVHPLCGFTRYLPVAALVPLCILWFGIDDLQKIAVITIGLVFQLILLFADDSSSVPLELIEAGRTFGLSKLQIWWRIVLPWAMPSIWSDLRVSAGWAWSYLVLAELVAGNRGIGYFIVQSQRYLETDRVFAGILFIGVLGMLTDQLFRFAGAKMFRWM